MEHLLHKPCTADLAGEVIRNEPEIGYRLGLDRE
jgi:hypothetical protein